MQTLKIEIPHQLGKAEAQKRIREGMASFQQQVGAIGVQGFASGWTGDRMSFSGDVMGRTIAGRIDVLEQAVRVELDLPTLLAAFGAAIIGRVKREGALLLEDKTRRK